MISLLIEYNWKKISKKVIIFFQFNDFYIEKNFYEINWYLIWYYNIIYSVNWFLYIEFSINYDSWKILKK